MKVPKVSQSVQVRWTCPARPQSIKEGMHQDARLVEVRASAKKGRDVVATNSEDQSTKRTFRFRFGVIDPILSQTRELAADCLGDAANWLGRPHVFALYVKTKELTLHRERPNFRRINPFCWDEQGRSGSFAMTDEHRGEPRARQGSAGRRNHTSVIGRYCRGQKRLKDKRRGIRSWPRGTCSFLEQKLAKPIIDSSAGVRSIPQEFHVVLVATKHKRSGPPPP